MQSTIILSFLLASVLAGCNESEFEKRSSRANDLSRERAALGLPDEEGGTKGSEDSTDGDGSGSGQDGTGTDGGKGGEGETPDGDGTDDGKEPGGDGDLPEGDGGRDDDVPEGDKGGETPGGETPGGETPGGGKDGGEIPGTGFKLAVTFYCSEDSSKTIGTDMTKAKGVSYKIYNSSGALAFEDSDAARATARRAQIIDFKTADLQVSTKLAAGTYYAVFCDVAMHSACSVPHDKVGSDTFDENDGAGLKGVVGLVTNMKIDASGALISAAKGQVLFPLPLSDAEKAECGEVDSPLMVDLTGAGFNFSAPSKGVQFDLNADGRVDTVSWPTGNNVGILALDSNNSGAIENGNELFGNNNIGPDGQKSANGFLSLAKHDSNGDGVISASDAVYAHLLLWRDLNSDGVSSANELSSLSSSGIVVINLSYQESSEKDMYGNQLGQRSEVIFSREGKESKGTIVDAWLRRF